MTFKKVINNRADEFLEEHITGLYLDDYRQAKSDLGEYLYELDLDFDKYAFLQIIENKVLKKTKKHLDKCKTPNCPVGDETDDFIYEVSKQKNRLSDRDELNFREVAILNEYIENLQNQIDLLGKSNHLSLELISDLKEELDELRHGIENASRKASKRQFYGTVYEVFKVLSKLGLEQEKVSKILNSGIENIDSIFKNELLMESGKLLIQTL